MYLLILYFVWRFCAWCWLAICLGILWFIGLLVFVCCWWFSWWFVAVGSWLYLGAREVLVVFDFVYCLLVVICWQRNSVVLVFCGSSAFVVCV